MGRKAPEDLIQEVQICDVVNAAQLGPSHFLDEVKKDVRNGRMEEETIIPMSSGTGGAIVQAAWRLILVELGVGMDVVNLKGGILTKLSASNKGFPLVCCVPTLLPQ